MLNQPTYHVLLIGIDGYREPRHRLHGCVNDIDAVERTLMTRVPNSRLRIKRLASPGPDPRPERPERRDAPATLANLRAELAALGTPEVASHDRVFIYYSGHGARLELASPGRPVLFREALVPVDHDAIASEPQFLCDFTLNELLGAITLRTDAVTLVLDCCHSSGVFRSSLVRPDRLDRCITFDRPTQLDPELASHISDDDAMLAKVAHCQIVAACHDHERAREERGSDGVHHGLMTRGFVAAIEAIPGVELLDLTWNQIWPAICEHVADSNPNQRPNLVGDAGRAVLAGHPVDRDPGIPVRLESGRYWIGAGTLGSITSGAQLALYGEVPNYFPPLASKADHDARIGMLRVEKAERSWAEAVAEAGVLALPPGARARLVSTGVAERLRYRVAPRHDQLDAALAKSPLLERAPDRSEPDVWLERHGDRWFVTDEHHGTGGDGPVLCALRIDQLDRARAVLEHYHAYRQPLRMAQQAKDLPGALELTLHRCPMHRSIRAAEAEHAEFPEITTRATGSYRVFSKALIFFKVTNASSHRLQVTLVNSAASGCVQVLGDQLVEPNGFRGFWANETLGSPYQMLPPYGADRCIDRLVAIGRTDLSRPIDYLRRDTSFTDILLRTRGDKLFTDSRATLSGPPPELWTAAQVLIESWRDGPPAGARP